MSVPTAEVPMFRIYSRRVGKQGCEWGKRGCPNTGAIGSVVVQPLTERMYPPPAGARGDRTPGVSGEVFETLVACPRWMDHGVHAGG